MLRPIDPDAAQRAAVRRKVGYFLLGIAIGLVILGLIHQARRNVLTPAPKPSTPAGP